MLFRSSPQSSPEEWNVRETPDTMTAREAQNGSDAGATRKGGVKEGKIFHSGWEHMLGERSIVAMPPLTTVVRHPDKTNDPSGRGGN